MEEPSASHQPEHDITSVHEENMKFTDVKITYVEHLSVINYLTKAIEDFIIGKISILKFPLLLIDIPLLFAVLIVNLERIIYIYVVEFILAYIRFDIRPITKKVSKIIPLGGEEYIAEDEDEDTYEETALGKFYQWLRGVFRFLWGLLVLAFVLPLWPIMLLYNFFVPIMIIGTLYYILMFFSFSGFLGGVLYYFIFCTVTFLVASVSVPAVLRVFIYIKYLFSLEKKNWREINNEARAAFLQFYLRIQQNRTRLLESAQSRYDKDFQAQGGIYYLFLKTIYGIKDKIFALRKKDGFDLLHKLEKGVRQISSDFAQEKEEYVKTVSQMSRQELLKTSVALLITFSLSALLAMGGSRGHGVLISIFRSFIDYDVGTTAWWNYEGSGMGYYQQLLSDKPVPGIVKIVVTGIDHIWGYFFQAYHFILPFYTTFFAEYYYYMGKIISAVFY